MLLNGQRGLSSAALSSFLKLSEQQGRLSADVHVQVQPDVCKNDRVWGGTG